MIYDIVVPPHRRQEVYANLPPKTSVIDKAPTFLLLESEMDWDEMRVHFKKFDLTVAKRPREEYEDE